MKKLLLAITVTASLLFASCNAGGGDPKTVLLSFMDAMGKKDIAAAKKLATKDSEQMFGLMEMGMKMAKDSKDMDQFDKTKMEFGEAKIEGDKATIPVKDKSSGESTNFILKKESGSWKVAFDKSSLMQMGTDKMKEKGVDMNDVINKGADAMKDINVDSLSDKMKEGLEKLNENKDKIEEAARKIEEAAKKLEQK
jgi:Domain of unknown function (DUF4878)